MTQRLAERRVDVAQCGRVSGFDYVDPACELNRQHPAAVGQVNPHCPAHPSQPLGRL